MCGYLLMSRKERERKVIFELVKERHMSLVQAALRLDLSYRQTLRCWKRYCEGGDTGLLHKSRGKLSNRRISDEYRHQVLDYYKQYLLGFEPTFASEKLVLAGLPIATETLRRLLIQEGLWKPKKRKAKYRTKRPRRQSFGELVQLDGSFHDWFDNGTKYCLMNMVDDSSSTTLAQLHDEETTEAAMRVLWAWIDKYGIPKALYTDKRTVYVTDREPTIDEQLAGIQPLTAFGKCCERLGIEIITAHSPQAKGRVERSNGTYQDRFIKELKFQNIQSVDTANTLLAESFCDDLNQRFAIDNLSDAHRSASNINLYNIFIWQETRTMSNDWTIRFNNLFYQLYKSTNPRLKPKAKITVRTHIDGQITLLFDTKILRYLVLDEKPPVTKMQQKAKLTPAERSEQSRRASKNSPWSRDSSWLFKKKGKLLNHRVHSP